LPEPGKENPAPLEAAPGKASNMMRQLQNPKAFVNLQTTHQPKQLDLFPATPVRSRRIISGRINFFPRQSKAVTPPDESPPFNDPIPEF
jgi:hypothetical protein